MSLHSNPANANKTFVLRQISYIVMFSNPARTRNTAARVMSVALVFSIPVQHFLFYFV